MTAEKSARIGARAPAVVLALLCGIASLACPADEAAPRPHAPNPERWEASIQFFERADRREMPEPGATLFIGSSSVRMWRDLQKQMHPRRTIRRGFGGAHLAHVTHFADRIVFPYRPSAIVVYAGENDLARRGRKAETLFDEFRAFCALVRERLPHSTIYFISIKPSPRRWYRWPEMQRANELVAGYARWHKKVEYIDITGVMLGPDGNPRRELYASDGLHLRRSTYELWAARVRTALGTPKAP